jgi:hypothetical protein
MIPALFKNVGSLPDPDSPIMIRSYYVVTAAGYFSWTIFSHHHNEDIYLPWTSFHPWASSAWWPGYASGWPKHTWISSWGQPAKPSSTPRRLGSKVNTSKMRPHVSRLWPFFSRPPSSSERKYWNCVLLKRNILKYFLNSTMQANLSPPPWRQKKVKNKKWSKLHLITTGSILIPTGKLLLLSISQRNWNIGIIKKRYIITRVLLVIKLYNLQYLGFDWNKNSQGTKVHY